MASVLKRGDKWIAQVFKKGVRKSATFSTKGRAQAWATQIEAEIISGIHQGRTDKTFADALDKYANEVTPNKRGRRWEEIRINVFKRLPFVHYKLSDVTTPRLAEWRDDRLKTVKTSTVNREMNLLSAVFEQARREWQWININPVRDVRRPPQPKHRERIFNDDEINKIVSYLCAITGNKRHIVGMAFLFSLETAMRREEITELTWVRVDMPRRTATLDQTKNGDSRKVPLSVNAVKVLDLMQGYERPFNVDKDVLSTLFRRACLQSGIEGATFHDARATALTRLSKRLNVLELARMAGHRDMRSLQVYYRETAEELAAKLD